MAAEADAVHETLAPAGLTRLAAGILWVERKNDSWKLDYGLDASFKNPFAIKRADGQWERYASYAMAAVAWAARLLDPAGPYAATTTVQELLSMYEFGRLDKVNTAYVNAVCAEIDALPLVKGDDMPPTQNPYPTPTIYDLSRDYARFGLSKEQAAFLIGRRFENRNGLAPKGIVLHIQDGVTPGSLTHWLGVQASSTVMIQKDGSILRVIPERHGPWTNGDVKAPTVRGQRLIGKAGGQNVNCVSLTIEAEGRPGDALTAGQKNAILWQCAEWMAGYGLTTDDIYAHGDLNSIDKARCGLYLPEVVTALKGQTWSDAPARKYANLPAWVSDAELEKLSMWDEQKVYADPTGPLTNAYIAHCRETGRWPEWIDLRDVAGGRRLHLSDGTLLDFVEGKAVVRGKA